MTNGAGHHKEDKIDRKSSEKKESKQNERDALRRSAPEGAPASKRTLIR